ncbi:MAG: alpha/beta hydrolase domain-containing protein [Acidimicrobiia bacterium]
MSVPRVEGPVTGGHGRPSLISTSIDLAAVGYEQHEWFVSGSARSFASDAPIAPDGRWVVTPAETAPFTTRIVVHRPVDPNGFRGTVVVEWFNVSAGFDTAPDWLAAHNVLIRDGVIWIGVSAQAAGIQGGDTPAAGGIESGGLTATDPSRYGSLHHPGDSFSYDIFSQVGLLARGGLSPDPVGGLDVQTVIAIGESQSAFRLVTYVNAVQPVARTFDGYLVHSRGGAAAPLSQAPLPEVAVPDCTIVRTDLDVPVLVFQTESDFTLLDYLAARQPDTERIRVWEVAGTAHADAYTALIGFNDAGDGRAEEQLLDARAIDGGPLGCANPINAGPAYAVLQAAIHGLIRWTAGGPPPTEAPRLGLSEDDHGAFARDAHGNVLGGIRTPFVDAPIATLRGDGNDGESFCRLFGTTTPFTGEKLASLYVSHEDYTAQFDASTDAAVRDGYLLPEEATNLKRAAARSPVPGP